MILALIMTAMLIPFTVSAETAAATAEPNRISDPSTMDSWQEHFGSGVYSTEHAGGVWVDKSVFTDASVFPAGTVTLDGEDNFLVALSAMASNKTIVGYSNIPTDTMLVLDLSGSMMNSNSVGDMVSAANDAMKSLYEVNNHNRVGVVLYSGSSSFGASNTSTATVILPLDRYTSENRDGTFLTYDDGKVSVSNRVSGKNGTVSTSNEKTATGGTYIQNGLYKAWQEFEKVDDVKIEDGFQSGMTRLPIIVLMSDGAPTSATTSYTNVGRSNIGNGSGACETDGVSFLTQLTASYVRARVEEKYGRSALFYTLGLNVESSDAAKNVLDPPGTASTLWRDYLALTPQNPTLSLQLPDTSSDSNGNPKFSYYTIRANSYCIESDYVDAFFSASNRAEMTENFQNIVDEIIIQSRYYPTNLQGKDPDFGGYITFTDRIGDYMEVKDIKGILLGDILFDGAMLTSKISTSSDGLGTVDNPTSLGDEFIRSVRARLGLDLEGARKLVEQAYEAKQLYYESDDVFSNYIGWYAKEDGSYAGFWQEGNKSHPDGAVYIVRSYGFLGKAEGNIKDSDMMFMTVRVQTNIKSGHETVVWQIPAALVPMVTYNVKLEGDSIENAKNITLDIIEAEPIRLVFEVGLDDTINELNVAEIMDNAESKHIADDGYYFWTNAWDENDTVSPYNDLSAVAGFVPSTENERYYYTEDSDIYVLDGSGSYIKVSYADDSGFDESVTYYHARTVFTLNDPENSNSASKSFVYEEISEQTLALKQHRDDGTWYIPRGTIYQEFSHFITEKAENTTDSHEYANAPYITITSASYEEDVMLGNNGRLKMTSAQGIRISKSLDIEEPGTNTEFEFRITLSAPDGVTLAEKYPYVLATTGEYTGESGYAYVENGVMTVKVASGQTVFITDIPENVSYKVEELSNEDYRLKSITQNGVKVNGGIANGTVKEYTLDSIAFVNTPTRTGDLIISKAVSHPFGESYEIPDISFNISVDLDGTGVANKTFAAVTASGETSVTTDANGVFNVTLGAGEAISVHDIPEQTVYTVKETNIPKGFTLVTNASALTGTLGADINSTVALTNAYAPEGVAPNIEIEIEKNLIGREINADDSFEFVLRRYSDVARTSFIEVGRLILSGAELENGELKGILSMAGEIYDRAGTYYYVLSEINDAASGKGIPGVTYDTMEYYFHVYVTDTDMDGYLEISDVIPTLPAQVSGSSDGGYTVSAVFNNSYAATGSATVSIDITKRIESASGVSLGLNGFEFGLYDGTSFTGLSAVTDAHGKAHLTLNFPASLIGTTIEYTLKEIPHETTIPGMTYSTEEKKITVSVIDNGDGTVGVTVNEEDIDSVSAEFVNIYDPTDAVLIISGTKTLSGRILNDGEFEFNLYETDEGFSIDGLEPIAVTTNTSGGSFGFPMMTYNSIGTKYYAVTETKGGLGGVTYDETVYTITVDIESGDTGVLVATAAVENGEHVVEDIIFANSYEASPVSVEIKGNKILSGRSINENEFSFVLTDAEGNETNATSDTKGAFAFESIEYSEAGVYAYTVSEQNNGIKGITYDNSVFNVTVTVKDNGFGKLVAAVEYVKNNIKATEIVFVNTYTASPAEVELTGTKKLTGRALNENEFEFELVNTATGEIIETVYNDANGDFRFTNLVFRTADVYHYTVSEADNGLGGVTYDNTIYAVTITVGDNGMGELLADVEYLVHGEPIEEIVFANSYEASKTTITFTGEKTLSGRDLAEAEFVFSLYETGEDYDITDVEALETTNAADGSFGFPIIEYTEAGDRYYVITENNTGKMGITYDTTVYNVKVSVTDDLNGALVAEADIVKASGESAETLLFANVYAPLSAEVTVEIIKTVQNNSQKTDIGADGFRFVLTQDGIAISEVTTDENGRASFTLSFSDADVGKSFTYNVSELNDGMPYMTYSEKVYEFVVTVSYESGELIASVTKDGLTENANIAEFVNVYNDPPKAGDNSSLIPWIALLLISGGAVISIAKKSEKKQRDF